jgi:chromosome partitioning protein
VNEKGGSAKTTLVASLAAYLALERGRRVLAVDLDPQGQLGKVLGLDVRAASRSAVDLLVDAVLDDDPFERPARGRDVGAALPALPTRLPTLDVVVANKALGLLEAAEGEADPTGRLARRLAQLHDVERYDFVLMDAPPSFGSLTLNVLRAAREIVVPVPLTYLALDGCAELLRTIHTVRTRFAHPELRVTMVVPTFYRRTRLAHEILAKLQERFPKEIAHCAVGYHVRIDEAQSRGLSIFEHAPTDRGARVMAELAEELELRGVEPERGASE